jgi:hypothetical protein
MLDEILNYFKERNEDSCYQNDKPNQIQLNADEFLVKTETQPKKYDEIEGETESDIDMESINERMMVMFNINSIHEAIDKVLGIE